VPEIEKHNTSYSQQIFTFKTGLSSIEDQDLFLFQLAAQLCCYFKTAIILLRNNSSYYSVLAENKKRQKSSGRRLFLRRSSLSGKRF
jgi:hypothetical protein